MRFGLCCGLGEADGALEAGFDYVELPAQQLLANEPEFVRLRPEATNLFFPGTIKLFGPEKTPYLDYAREVIERAARVGVSVMVVGSGGSRRAPEGVAPADAEAQFARVAAELAEIAEPLGIQIAPESLNRSETNVGNNLGKFAQSLRDLGVGYTADSYHVISEWVFDGNEPAAPLEHWRDQVPYLPTHVHFGDRARVDPTPGDPDVELFVQRLKELGYDGRVSLECKRRSPGDLARALRDCKQLFA
ncbi:MAG: sugar phosphate isomerase/epimerase family protein [Fimbriimonas sp.]